MTDHDEIRTAQEMLLEALGAYAQELQRTGGEAFGAGELDAAEELLERAKVVRGLLEEYEALGQRLYEALGEEESPRPEPGTGPTTHFGQYQGPVLQALVDLGGRAETSDALDRVHELMAAVLTPADHERVLSGRVRWKSTAAWVRFRLVKEGLLADDSPYGVWEITEEGRRWLEEQG